MRIDGSAGYSGYDLQPVRRPPEGPTGPASPRETHAELRSVLSADEAAYFAELERLGPLTYGRRVQDAAAPPPVLGQRVDVRA